MIDFLQLIERKFLHKNLKLIFLLSTMACTVTDGQEDIPSPNSHKSVVWLDELIDQKKAVSPRTFYVLTCQVNLKKFYLIHHCCAFCQDKWELYDENGILICIYSTDLEIATSNCAYKRDEMEELSIYWQPPNLACDL